jgi:rRNA-processing protein FCF1
VALTLYMDEQVQRSITRGLRARGVRVITAQEDNHATTPDDVVLDRAGELGCVVFTRDDDFLREATSRVRAGVSFAGVIYAHQLAVSIGDCIRDLELIALATDAVEYRDRVEYLPLR